MSFTAILILLVFSALLIFLLALAFGLAKMIAPADDLEQEIDDKKQIEFLMKRHR